MSIDIETAEAAFADAELIHDRAAVEAAIAVMAQDISRDLAGHNLLVFCIMNGGLILAGKLLPLLRFPLRVDYVHATRYRGATRGAELQWERQPARLLAGEDVLLLDDILDEGETLNGIVRYCRDAGAASIHSAVLVRKRRRDNQVTSATYVGLEAPDRYLFGYGMDYKGYWRNADGIFAVAPHFE